MKFGYKEHIVGLSVFTSVTNISFYQLVPLNTLQLDVKLEILRAFVSSLLFHFDTIVVQCSGGWGSLIWIFPVLEQ